MSSDPRDLIHIFPAHEGGESGYSERSEHDFTASGMPSRFTIKINGERHYGSTAAIHRR